MKRLLLIVFFTASYTVSLFSLTWETADLTMSFNWQYNAQIGSEPEGKYPSVVKFTIGSSAFADWDGERGGLFFYPAGWFSWNIEDVYKGTARPCPEEAADSMKVLGLMADAPFGYAFKAGSWDLGLQGGLSLYFRFPLWTAQEGTAEPAELWKAYYGKAEFLYFNFSFWASFPVAEKIDFLFGIRYYQPFSGFWTIAPAVHGIQAGLYGSVRFALRPKH
jgi:hypothetical protein